MKPADRDVDEDDPRVLQAARDYLADLEAGRKPDRRAYLSRHPELADALTECLDGIELAHTAGQAIRPFGSPVAAEPSSEPLGDFRISREIGRGGMGIVYEAVQLSLGRRVALKVLPFASGLDAKQLQRFKTEAHAAAQLHHTNIVPVYAVGQERGVHFYAMQLIEGRSLDKVIRDWRGDGLGPESTASTVDIKAAATKPAAPATVSLRSGRGWESYRTAARIIAQVADALEYAHEAGVIHRDIKPANLLLDAKGNVWVTDFGLAQVTAEAGMTQTGDIVGTLRYMSPEQASGRRVLVDHRTDIYSLGATLYELLALQPIFPSSDRPFLLRQILEDEPRPPRQIDRSVPAELETIALKAVAKDPVDRYATAGEMAADLRRFLDGLPILARRPTPVERARKWVRRHPSGVGTAVLLLALSVVGLAVSNALVSREQGRTEQALDGERQRGKEAQQRFELARRAADEMIRMAEQELADQPHLLGLRKQLLEVALDYYQEFIELRRHDPEAQAELALTRDKVLRILDDLAVLRSAGQLYLLGEAVVLDDLKLDAEQRAEVVHLSKRLAEQRQQSYQDSHLLSPQERRQRFLEVARANDAVVAKVLSREQRHRLGQIALQIQGLGAFRDAYVVAELKLAAEQRDRIRDIERETYFGKSEFPPRVGPPSKGLPSREAQEKKVRAALAKVVDAVLKPDQQEKWQEMIGDPLKGSVSFRPLGPFGFPEFKGPGGPPAEPKVKGP